MKNNKLVWLSGIIGAIYALIPILISFWGGGLQTQGEYSPMYILILPPFWPLLVTTILSVFLFSLLIKIGINMGNSLEGLGMLLNVVWWALIGILIGLTINKIKGRNKN